MQNFNNFLRAALFPDGFPLPILSRFPPPHFQVPHGFRWAADMEQSGFDFSASRDASTAPKTGMLQTFGRDENEKDAKITTGSSGVPSFVFEDNQNKTSLTKLQHQHLEACFSRNHYPPKDVIRELSAWLGLTENKLQIWFQNRRAKQRRLENTRKKPGRPSLAHPPLNCSGTPIPRQELIRKKHREQPTREHSPTNQPSDGCGPRVEGETIRVKEEIELSESGGHDRTSPWFNYQDQRTSTPNTFYGKNIRSEHDTGSVSPTSHSRSTNEFMKSEIPDEPEDFSFPNRFRSISVGSPCCVISRREEDEDDDVDVCETGAGHYGHQLFQSTPSTGINNTDSGIGSMSSRLFSDAGSAASGSSVKLACSASNKRKSCQELEDTKTRKKLRFSIDSILGLVE